MPVLLDNKWAEAHFPEAYLALWRQNNPGSPLPKRYVVGQPHKPILNAIVTRDEIAKDDLRWHISVARPDRMPTWEDLVSAAHNLRPGVVFVIGLPPRSWWVNVHPYCLHLTETRDQHLIEQWRYEGRGDEPS